MDSIDKLLTKYLCEGIDRYDDMDIKIRKVSLQMDKDVKQLKRARYKVTSLSYPDYDVDGDIDVGNDYHIQVTLNGEYILTHSEGNKFKSLGAWNNIDGLIRFLYNIY